MPDEKIDQKRPVHAENELKKMQQRLVDDTVDDSFPASDPPAWTTSGSKSVAAECDPEPSSPEKTSSTGAEEPVRRAVEGAKQLAQDAYRTGERYIEEGRRRYPEAKKYYQRGRQTIVGQVQEAPLAAMLVAGAVGYVLALLIHGRSATPASRSDAPPFSRRPPLNEAQRHGMR